MRRKFSGWLYIDFSIKKIIQVTNNLHYTATKRILKTKLNIILKFKATKTNEPFDSSFLSAINENDNIKYEDITKYDYLRDYCMKLKNKEIISRINNNNEVIYIYIYASLLWMVNLFWDLIADIIIRRDSWFFKTDNNLKFLKQSKIWFCDGTFLFHQKISNKCINYIVNSPENYTNYLCIYEKEINSYFTVFNYIKEKIEIVTETIITDLKVASHKSLVKVFKKTYLKGCYFRYCQKKIRYLKKNLFIEKYKKCEIYKNLLKK